MWTESRTVRMGDLVIIWMTRDSLLPLTIEPGKELNGKFGVYRHEDLIGTPYGSKVASRNGRGYVHLLRPTPELWTLALPHRTQILYMADIAFITSWLALKPGSVVIEAGTGSGSFSHSVTRTIGPKGHLHSFEYHVERAKKAKAEFARHGMEDCVTLSHRNVCKDGFDLVDEVDAVFLDLPAPWDAVQYARKALKKNTSTRICCFSPCMEQVLRTVSALNEAGFTGITMYETLVRPQDITPVSQPSIETAVKKLKQAEVSGEERRLRQIENARTRNKRKREEAGATMERSAGDDTSIPPEPKKRRAVDSTETGDATAEEGEVEDALLPDADDSILPAPTNGHDTEPSFNADAPARLSAVLEPSPTIPMAHPFPEVRGHTSYLTFAVLLPYDHLTGNTSSNHDVTSTQNGKDATQSTIANTTTTTEGNSDYAELDEYFRSIPESELQDLR